MPQAAPIHPPELEDVVENNPHPADGFVEVASNQGYGRLVVTSAESTDLIATGKWVAYP